MKNTGTDLWLFPLADLLQLDLRLREKDGHTLIEAYRKMKWNIGAGIILVAPVESRGGWIHGDKPGERQAVLLLKFKGKLYGMSAYSEATGVVSLHLLNRDKVKSAGYLEDQVQIGESIKETYFRLDYAIFASYVRKLHGDKWLKIDWMNDKAMKPGEHAVSVGDEAAGDQQTPVPSADSDSA